jgi:hypothetical protein
VIATWRPSLRRTLLTNLVAPAIVLAIVLGIGGMLLIQRVVQTSMTGCSMGRFSPSPNASAWKMAN